MVAEHRYGTRVGTQMRNVNKPWHAVVSPIQWFVIGMFWKQRLVLLCAGVYFEDKGGTEVFYAQLL